MTRFDNTIREGIAQRGYCLVEASSFHLTPDQRSDLAEFLQYWDELVLDPYLPIKFGRRFRRHARFRYDSDNRQLTLQPNGEYFQDADVNPVMGGIKRRFAPLSEKMAENLFFQRFLVSNAEALKILDFHLYNINVHFIRIPCDGDTLGYPCPEGIHRDGFSRISIHLMGCYNIVGAKTTLFNAEEKPIFDDCLTGVLDSIYADDQAVLHYTAPFKPNSGEYGHRDTLLVSYDPAI